LAVGQAAGVTLTAAQVAYFARQSDIIARGGIIIVLTAADKQAGVAAAIDADGGESFITVAGCPGMLQVDRDEHLFYLSTCITCLP
jgi:hypothetical protein